MRYVMRPVNLLTYIHTIPFLQDDWSNVFTPLLHKVSIELMNDVIYLRLNPTTDDNLERLRSSLPRTITSECIDGAVYVKMTLPELSEFINTSSEYKYIVSPLDGYPNRFSFLGLVDYDIGSNPLIHSINHIQAQVYESIRNSNIQGELTQDQLLSILNEQRLRHNIIQCILNSDLSKYGMNYSELRLIDYMAKNDTPVITSTGPYKSEIRIRSNNDEVINTLTQLLRDIYPEAVIRSIKDNGIISSKVPMTSGILRDIRYSCVDGCVIMRPGLFRTIRMIQSLHCPVTTTKIHVGNIIF